MYFSKKRNGNERLRDKLAPFGIIMIDFSIGLSFIHNRSKCTFLILYLSLLFTGGLTRAAGCGKMMVLRKKTEERPVPRNQSSL